jgi:NAD(P)-dependent dehydrogenase (short-subunit alcohol dehydrogenase family)
VSWSREVCKWVPSVRGRTDRGGKGEGDVSDSEDVRKVVETAREAYDPVEVLVSNAGFLQQQPFVDLIVENFDRMISVHSRGTFLCIHAVLPEMLSVGRRFRRKVRGV